MLGGAVPFGDTLTVVQSKGSCGLRSLLRRYACCGAKLILLVAWLVILTSAFCKETLSSSGIRSLWCKTRALAGCALSCGDTLAAMQGNCCLLQLVRKLSDLDGALLAGFHRLKGDFAALQFVVA
ncbi:hypothetical protein YSY43_49230 [Paenibacillus sp. YSY-4.3]